MDEREFLFFRGSSPTLELVLPLAVGPEDWVYASFYQRDQVILDYVMAANSFFTDSIGLRRDAEHENVLLLCMTKEDTLQLEAGDVELQLHIQNGIGSDTFRPLLGRVGPMRVKKEEVIPV